MKLAAIFNVWVDAIELLPFAVRNIRKCGADLVVIVYSRYSNYGEDGGKYCMYSAADIIIQCEPIPGQPAAFNETRKRNAGLQIARDLGATHFLTMDCDEFYEPEAFKRETKRFHGEHLNGLVCGCQTYFRSPCLTIGLDTTLVPFIHKLTATISHGMNRNYPFAWDPGIRIDPTRQLNINSGVEWSTIVMHHMSWIRKDYGLKIRNSTARRNIERSTILQDLLQAKEGYFCKFYQKPLVRAQVDFGIPDYELSNKDLQLMASASQAP